MALFRPKPTSVEDIHATTTESGVVPAIPDGDRDREPIIPKMWREEAEDQEVTGTTGHIPASVRALANPRLTIMTGLSAGQVISLDAPQIEIGRSRAADLCLNEEGVSRQHCRVVRRDGFVFVEDLGSRNGTLVNGMKVTSAQLVPGDRIQLGTDLVLQLGMFDDAEETLARKLYDTSTRDPLTRAYNRHYFCQRLDAEMSHAQRHDSELSVLMLDLDGLKAVNEEHGPTAGDEVLRAVVAAISHGLRGEDLFCRYSGEEFAFVVKEPLTSAARTAERLRLRIEALRVNVGKKRVQVTASLGVAELGEPGAQLTGEGLLRVAEKRLRRAKLLGRNRVVIE